MHITTIKEILGDRALLSVSSEQTVRDAAGIMAANSVGALAVIDEEKLVGIVSERDIVFRAVGQSLPVETTPVADIMTPEPVTLDIDDTISDSLAAKLGDVFRHLPVMENGRAVGLLSYRDIPPEYVMMFERFREMSAARPDDVS